MATIACGVSGKPCPTEEAFPPCNGTAEYLISIEPVGGSAPAIRPSDPTGGLPKGNSTPTLDQLNAVLTEESPTPGKGWIEYAGFRGICRSIGKPYSFFFTKQWPPPFVWKHPDIDMVEGVMGLELDDRQHRILRNVVAQAFLDGVSSAELETLARAIIDTGDADDYLYRLFALVSLAGARILVEAAGSRTAFLGDMYALEQDVGAAIADGRISFERREIDNGAPLLADYFPDDNAVFFPPLDEGKLSKLSAMMVHELTHAEQDLNERTVVRIEAEREGYLREWTINILRDTTRKMQAERLDLYDPFNRLVLGLSAGTGAVFDLYNACLQAISDALLGLGSAGVSKRFDAYYRIKAAETPHIVQTVDEVYQFDGI